MQTISQRQRRYTVWLSLLFSIPGLWLACNIGYIYFTGHEKASLGFLLKDTSYYSSIHLVFFIFALFFLLKFENKIAAIVIKLFFDLLTLIVIIPILTILIASFHNESWLRLGGATAIVMSFLFILVGGWALIYSKYINS
jgi:hypothetical protein